MPGSEIKIGAHAPQFNLKDEHGQPISLNDLRGKQSVILVFYPGDMTPGCAMQLCALRDDWPQFQHHQLAVFGINHAEAISHQLFIRKHSLPFPLLVDTEKKVSRLYGALHRLFRVNVIRRSVIGIDKDGVIRYLKRGLPKNSDILKIMKPYVS